MKLKESTSYFIKNSDLCLNNKSINFSRLLILLIIGFFVCILPAFADDITRPITTHIVTINGIPTDSTDWINKPAVIALNATDDLSGIKETLYSINMKGALVYNAPFTLNDGIYSISYRSEDNAGNKEIPKYFFLKIDTIRPVTTHLMTSNGIPTDSTSWLPRPVVLTLSATDNLSGVKETLYSINSQTPVKYTMPISLDNGCYTITYRSEDFAGNKEYTKTVVIKVGPEPKVEITEPVSGAGFNLPPIRVAGTVNEVIKKVFINDTYNAIIQNGTFFCDYVDLKEGLNTINVKGYDNTDYIVQDEVIVTSTFPTQFELTKLTPDYNIFDEARPLSGSNIDLGLKLIIDNLPKQNESIKFEIIEGSGTLSSATILTNDQGEAHTTLTLDTNSSTVNTIKAYDQNYPQKPVEFSISTKPNPPSALLKITDEAAKPCPNVSWDLVVKLVDQYQNPIENQVMNFQIISGSGTLISSEATTDQYGQGKVIYTTPQIANSISQIQAELSTNPAIQTVFTITTSDALPHTVEEVIAKVQANDALIQDIKADIHVTSNAPWSEPVMDLKIWQKGDKQKVQEISPTPQTKIRPPLETSTTEVIMERTLISYDPATNIYVIKTKKQSQIDEYPYDIDYVDYNKGVVLKTEHFLKEGDYVNKFVNEYSDFAETNGVWGFQKLTETVFDGSGNQSYRTVNIYSNIQINIGISDSEFY